MMSKHLDEAELILDHFLSVIFAKHKIMQMLHQPYSPGQVSYDFYLFPKLKFASRIICEDIEDMKRNTMG